MSSYKRMRSLRKNFHLGPFEGSDLWMIILEPEGRLTDLLGFIVLIFVGVDEGELLDRPADLLSVG